jgi:hypothetical protein
MNALMPQLRDNPISGVGANLILKAISTKENLRHLDFSVRRQGLDFHSVFFQVSVLQLCPVNTDFVTAASKILKERPEMFIDHTGDRATQALLPKYQIDFEAIAAKKAKTEAAKKAKMKK